MSSAITTILSVKLGVFDHSNTDGKMKPPIIPQNLKL